jgi:hypothetical protein
MFPRRTISTTTRIRRTADNFLFSRNFQYVKTCPTRMMSSTPLPSSSLQSESDERVVAVANDDRKQEPIQCNIQRHDQKEHQQHRQQRQRHDQKEHRQRNIQKNKNSRGERTDKLRPNINKKWVHPFWLPPGPASASPSSSQNNNTQQQNYRGRNRNRNNRFPNVQFRDVNLPCRRHLDPHDSTGLSTSNWVQIFGALPMTSLEEVLNSIENILIDELTSSDKDGVIDLDSFWNPLQDASIPMISPFAEQPRIDEPTKEHEIVLLDQEEDEEVTYNNSSNDSNSEPTTTGDDNDDCYNSNEDANNTDAKQIEPFRVRKAHVVLSPFGRPTGWNLELANASMVNALLSASNDSRISGSIRIGWKFAQVKEYHPPPSPVDKDPKDSTTMLTVDDTMVRFESCPNTLTQDHLRHLLSRYELAMTGETIVKWKGMTNTGDYPPLTYVVRFSDAAWARAAVREMQAFELDGKTMKLIQYPRQLK